MGEQDLPLACRDISAGRETLPVPAFGVSDWRTGSQPACTYTPFSVLHSLSTPDTEGTVGVEGGEGWEARTAEAVSAGSFVCEYAGELLSNVEAQRRLSAYDVSSLETGHALLVVRELLPSGRAVLRTNIDATSAGNVARFINHSCDGGNLELEVRREQGRLLPRGHVLEAMQGGALASAELYIALDTYLGTACKGQR